MVANIDFIMGSEKFKTYFQYHWNLILIHALLFQNLYNFVQNNYLDNPVKLWSQGQRWIECCIVLKIVDGSELSIFSLSLTQQKQVLRRPRNIVSILSNFTQSSWMILSCFYHFQSINWMWGGLERNPPHFTDPFDFCSWNLQSFVSFRWLICKLIYMF